MGEEKEKEKDVSTDMVGKPETTKFGEFCQRRGINSNLIMLKITLFLMYGGNISIWFLLFFFFLRRVCALASTTSGDAADRWQCTPFCIRLGSTSINSVMIWSAVDAWWIHTIHFQLAIIFQTWVGFLSYQIQIPISYNILLRERWDDGRRQNVLSVLLLLVIW